MKNPGNIYEWQEAVDAAEGALHLHSARCYGLVRGGPEVNIDRCQEILRLGRSIGVHPKKNAVEQFLKGIING